MPQAMMRRFATVAASAVLLSGAAAMAGGQAFAAPAGEHPVRHAEHGTHVHHAKHVHHVKKVVERWSWDRGVDKRKDKWDARHHCWTRYDSESRSNAQWNEKRHCWTRSHHGHAQKWDAKRHCWK
jgi:hypothetical protein